MTTVKRPGGRGGSSRLLLRSAVAGALLAALCSCSNGSDGSHGSVTILVPWSGTELSTFESAVVTPFEHAEHIHVDVVSTRALDEVLAADTERGDPPELAIVPTPQTVAYYHDKGVLYPITDALQPSQWKDYPARWRTWLEFQDPGQAQPQEYGAFVKISLNSLIWYDPRDAAHRAPTDWSRLLALGSESGQTPWCLGLAQPPVSGWPGTHWIEDVLLHEAGPTTYSSWVQGALPWTSGPVLQAWTDWGKMIGAGRAVYGGGAGAAVTDVGDAGLPMLTSEPPCYFDHEGSYAEAGFAGDPLLGKSGQKATPKAGQDFDVVPFPATGQGSVKDVAVAGDVAAMFKPTDQAKALIAYMLDAGTQQTWVDAPDSGVYSLDSTVTYDGKDSVAQHIAQVLGDPANTMCFGASDVMTADLRADFYQAVVEYLQNPGRLQQILSELDVAQRQANLENGDYASKFGCTG